MKAYTGEKATAGEVPAEMADQLYEAVPLLMADKARKWDQLQKEKALAKFDAWAHGFLKADDFIDQLYKDLSRRP